MADNCQRSADSSDQQSLEVGLNSTEDPQSKITTMFDRVAARYDLLNEVLSLGLHRRWRQKLLTWIPDEDLTASADQPRRLVDVGTGSGDVVLLAARQLSTYSEIIGVDLSMKMLDVARAKLAYKSHQLSMVRLAKQQPVPRVEFVLGDGRKLPIKSASVHSLTIAFGLRNIQGIDAALAEFQRVLVPGGTLLVLEFMAPASSRLARWFWRAGSWVLPKVASLLVRQPTDYAYLAQSVRQFKTVEELTEVAQQRGLEMVKTHRFLMGICHLLSFQKIS